MMRFARTAGGVRASLEEVEADLLRDLVAQLVELLDQRRTSLDASPLSELGIGGSGIAPEDPALARLLPDAYRDDPAASADFRGLNELGLLDRKLTHARVVLASLNATDPILDDDTAASWLRSLTDLRLVLATRLGIADPDQNEADDLPSDESAMNGVYEWLGWLQSMLLESIH